MTIKLTPDLIAAAIRGYESKLAELRAMLPGPANPAAPEATSRKRKKFSAATRRKMALAQKARWAKAKRESEPAQPAATLKPVKPKRRISKAGMARIIAATKKRWARVRAAKAQREKAARKKVVAVTKAGRRPMDTPRKTALKMAAPRKAAVIRTAPVPAPGMAPTPSQ